MFTINAYAFHPLAARFKKLWRRTQVVSGWLVFLVSWVLCPCMSNKPFDQFSTPTTSKKPSSEACQVVRIKSKADSCRLSKHRTPSLVQSRKQLQQEAGDTAPSSPEFFDYVHCRSERELFVTSEDLELRETLDLEGYCTGRPDRMRGDDCPSVHTVKSTSKKRSSASCESGTKQSGRI